MKLFRHTLVAATLLVASGLAVWWTATLTQSSNPREAPGQQENPQRESDDGRNLTQGAPVALNQTLPLPSDTSDSSHPVARAVAEGVVLETRFESNLSRSVWTRERLVQTKVQPRPVRVVEDWTQASETGEWVCARRDMYLADQLIIKARADIPLKQFKQQLASLGIAFAARLSDGAFIVRLSKHNLDAAPEALLLLAAHPEIAETAEMDGVGFGGAIPNDSRFDEQWALHNTGQSGGTPNADIDAPEFWDHIENTPGMIMAVIDSGLNYNHPDLQNLLDASSRDFVNSDNDPLDDHGHGSNVTSIIAATRNNGEGIAGLIGGVRILACKVLNASNSGTTSDLIAGVTYARQQGVPIMNLSLQNYPYSGTLDAEFTACQNAGILLCICAGNGGADNDVSPNYPSCYPHPNIISVGNHDRTDVRYSGSNFGATSVDLFAPGRDILTPGLGATYALHTGTSESTPFVTAVATALKYLNPSWKAPEIKSRILASVVSRSSYNGLCVTGGRLNAFASLGITSSPPVITIQPTSQTVAAGSPVTFTTAASGDPAPTFQWKFGGTAINGATSSSYTITSPGASDAGSYTVVATNSAGTATSNPAVLTIIVAPSAAIISIAVE